MSRRPCEIEGCDVGSSRGPFCATHDPDKPLRRVLPMEPLVALVAARGGPVACGLAPGTSEYRNYSQAKKLGTVTPARADRLVHELLGCHPCEVWGEWFGPYGVSV